MTDTMFTTTTAEDLAERFFRLYLSVSTVDRYGIRTTPRHWAGPLGPVANEVNEIFRLADAERVSFRDLYRIHDRMVEDQKAIDHAMAEIPPTRVDCTPDCHACFGKGCLVFGNGRIE